MAELECVDGKSYIVIKTLIKKISYCSVCVTSVFPERFSDGACCFGIAG